MINVFKGSSGKKSGEPIFLVRIQQTLDKHAFIARRRSLSLLILCLAFLIEQRANPNGDSVENAIYVPHG